MTCRKFVELLAELLAGALDSAQRAESDVHLAECPACVAYVDGYQKTVQFGKAAYGLPENGLREDLPEQWVHSIVTARPKEK